ncbi:spiro-SPASM protein [Treponema sp.]
MNAIAVLFANNLAPEAFEPLNSSSNALSSAVAKARSFPSVKDVVLLCNDGFEAPDSIQAIKLVRSPKWGKKSVLEALDALSHSADLPYSVDLLYFAWADCPLLDPELAAAIADRHLKYAAEYSYADGWPYGFAPEILAPTTAHLLALLAGEDEGPVGRDLLFSVLQKDINSFDIETEISPQDLRSHRLSLSADSKRNLLLLQGFMAAGLSKASEAEALIKNKPELLRTLPAFYAIQISGPCPQECALCPYPLFGKEDSGKSILERRDFMELSRFEGLLDSIVSFSGDAVIDISLWGEAALHPEIEAIIGAVLDRPELSLILETSGLSWPSSLIDRLSQAASQAKKRVNGMAPLTWIVSLDSDDPERYQALRGEGYAEAKAFAERLLRLFPQDTHVQALRIVHEEEDLEQFYRFWKAKTPNVIVQKHDDFCGFLPKLKASDLSPVKRQPCWHLMRDMSILLDGSVRLCKEDLGPSLSLGNVFLESLETIWAASEKVYLSHTKKEYQGICANCDEYYTYNF